MSKSGLPAVVIDNGTGYVCLVLNVGVLNVNLVFLGILRLVMLETLSPAISFLL